MITRKLMLHGIKVLIRIAPNTQSWNSAHGGCDRWTVNLGLLRYVWSPWHIRSPDDDTWGTFGRRRLFLFHVSSPADRMCRESGNCYGTFGRLGTFDQTCRNMGSRIHLSLFRGSVFVLLIYLVFFVMRLTAARYLYLFVCLGFLTVDDVYCKEQRYVCSHRI